MLRSLVGSEMCIRDSYMGLVVEATRGTLPTGGTPVYIPVTSPQVTPMQTFLRDEAFRGSPTVVYDQVQGVRHDEYDAKFYLFADTFGNLAKSILGGTDTVTGSSVYTHNIKLLNSASTGSQPQSYSILDFDGANYFTMTGAQADSLNITFGAEAAADATVKFMANYTFTDSTARVYPDIEYNGSTLEALPGQIYALDADPGDGRWTSSAKAPVTPPEAPVEADSTASDSTPTTN